MESDRICPKCGFYPKKPFNLKRHMDNPKECDPNKIHGRTKRTVDINSISEIIQQETVKNNNKCEICNETFTRGDSLKRHLKSDKHAENVIIHGNNNINMQHVSDTIAQSYNNTNKIKLIKL